MCKFVYQIILKILRAHWLVKITFVFMHLKNSRHFDIDLVALYSMRAKSHELEPVFKKNHEINSVFKDR